MIYVVEDDDGIRDIEVYTLSSVGFPAVGFADGASMFDALRVKAPALILLDVMLPGEDGVSILKRLKASPATSDIPVLMATAKGAEFDKIISLDLGADDYLVKPFGMMEMAARVRAVLRRSAPSSDPSVLSLGGICLNTYEHSVLVNGERVTLTLKEFDVLHMLMSRPAMVFSRERLLSDVWGMDYDGETRTVDVHVRTLRQKL